MKIEEIKGIRDLSFGEPIGEEHLSHIELKINQLIKAHNEREEDHNAWQKEAEKAIKPLSHFFKPEKTETYYRINARLKIEEDANYESEDDKHNISIGNCYRTREEAQLALDRQQALVRLWDWADENCYFRPDWESKVNYHAVYDFLGRKLFSSGVTLKCGDILPYFKLSEDCENFIKNNKEDLELILK